MIDTKFCRPKRICRDLQPSQKYRCTRAEIKASPYIVAVLQQDQCKSLTDTYFDYDRDMHLYRLMSSDLPSQKNTLTQNNKAHNNLQACGYVIATESAFSVTSAASAASIVPSYDMLSQTHRSAQATKVLRPH